MAKKVEEQKGPIEARQYNYRFMPEMECFMQDRMNGQMKREGQMMQMEEPKMSYEKKKH